MRTTSISKNSIHAYYIFIISCKRLLFSHHPFSTYCLQPSSISMTPLTLLSNTNCQVYSPVYIYSFIQCMFTKHNLHIGPVLDIGWYELCLHRVYNLREKQMYTDKYIEQDKRSVLSSTKTVLWGHGKWARSCESPVGGLRGLHGSLGFQIRRAEMWKNVLGRGWVKVFSQGTVGSGEVRRVEAPSHCGRPCLPYD